MLLLRLLLLLKGLTPMPPPPGFGVGGLCFGVWGVAVKYGVWGLCFGVSDLGSGIWSLRLGLRSGIWCLGLGSGSRGHADWGPKVAHAGRCGRFTRMDLVRIHFKFTIVYYIILYNIIIFSYIIHHYSGIYVYSTIRAHTMI